MKGPWFKIIDARLSHPLFTIFIVLGWSAAVALTGCVSATPKPAAGTKPAPAQTSGVAARDASGGDYEIAPEDLLEISVWREKDLQREVLVRPDGWFTFPLIGNIDASGKTTAQLQSEVTTRLKKYIPDPVVTVTVKKIQGLKVFVIGKVGKPGEYVVGRYVNVLQALTLAGGLTPFASESDIRILRKQSGKEQVILFDYSRVKKGRNLEQNIRLQAGDVIMVP
jgi:polysaccharide export outer membrane protein